MRSGNSMIYLKEANMADAQKEYEFITQLLEDDIYICQFTKIIWLL